MTTATSKGRIGRKLRHERGAMTVVHVMQGLPASGKTTFARSLDTGEYDHEVVDHAETYVNGRVHTNSMENFWSLFKRSLHGTYVSVEPYHLFRYLDERCFAFNLRDRSDYGRFEAGLRAVAGRRLTFAEVTGG